MGSLSLSLSLSLGGYYLLNSSRIVKICSHASEKVGGGGGWF